MRDSRSKASVARAEDMTNVNPAIGLIVKTDASCRLNGQFWPDIPTLVWPDGIDESVSDWLRDLVVEQGILASSAYEYAKVIRPFLRFCRKLRRSWESVDDQFLIIWRGHLHRTLGLSVKRVNTSLKTIFAFYRWAEETKRIRFRVGIYPLDELPPPLQQITFPISAKRTFSKAPSGRVDGSWTTPLTLSGALQSSPVRHTPTEDEIRALHENVVERIQGERDSLMFSWAEEAGPRRAEFLQVGKSHMPSGDQLADLIEKDEPWAILVRRKGGKTKPLNVPTDLIIRTLDFIEFERREIVEKCLETIVGYREPDALFLSSTTGLVLHPDSVTSIGRRAFRQTGIQRANIHRLRARFAVRTIETLVEAVFSGQFVGSESSWVETILVKAAEVMGHADPRSLRPYLTYVLNRRIQTADATKAEKLSARLRQLRLHEGTLVRRLAEQHELLAVANHIRAGRKAEAASTLREMADRLSVIDSVNRPGIPGGHSV